MAEKFGNHTGSAPAESNRYTWTGGLALAQRRHGLLVVRRVQSGSNKSKRLPPTRFRPQPPARGSKRDALGSSI